MDDCRFSPQSSAYAMAAQYQPVASTEQILEPVYTARPRSSHACWSVSLAVVSLVNICILLFSINIWHSTGDATPATCEAAIATPGASTTLVTDGAHNTAIGLAMVDDLPAAYVSFHWKTPWGAPNATWADALWDNINTAHGHIAIDHEWAAKNNVSFFISFTVRMFQRDCVVDSLHLLVDCIDGCSRQTGKGVVSSAGLPSAALPCKYTWYIKRCQLSLTSSFSASLGQLCSPYIAKLHLYTPCIMPFTASTHCVKISCATRITRLYMESATVCRGMARNNSARIGMH